MSRTWGLVWRALRPPEWTWRVLRALLTFAALVAVTVGMVALLSGCPSTQAQAVAADAMARALNAATPTLVADYQREGDAAIAGAPTAAEAEQALAGIRARWAPVWDALDTFASAHDSWATAIETGATPGLAELRGPWCDLRHAVLTRVALPDFPGAPCP